VEDLLCTTCSYNGNDAIIEDSRHNRLVNVHGFDFGKVHFKGSSAYETGFDNNPPVSNHEFRHRPLDKRSKRKCEQRFKANEDHPVIFCFEYHRFIPDKVVVNVSAHDLKVLETVYPNVFCDVSNVAKMEIFPLLQAEKTDFPEQDKSMP